MEILKFTIAAGENKRFEKAGRYIEVIEADSALSILFYDASGGQADDAQGIVSGLFVEIGYKAFNVTSAVAQTVTLLIADGRGGSRRQPGNVSIIDAVMSSCQTQTASQTAIGFTVAAIVTPASNVAGLIVRSSIVAAQAGAGGSANARLVGALVAPAGIVPAAQSVILSNAFSTNSGVVDQFQNFESRRRLPPGWGLYLLTNHTVAIATSAVVVVSFELL